LWESCNRTFDAIEPLMLPTPENAMSYHSKSIAFIPCPPPAADLRLKRDADWPKEGSKPSRYTLPERLISASPVGYRTRLAISEAEAAEIAPLFALERPTAFVPGKAMTEKELFEECSLGVLTSRQSTNFRGHKQVSFGPEGSVVVGTLLKQLKDLEAPVLDGAQATHVVLTRPYRTPFTLLLTFVGHAPFLSLFTVPWRALRKRFAHADDVPSVGYLQHLHLGILADVMERAAVIASNGQRMAQIFQASFSSVERRAENAAVLKRLTQMTGLSKADQAQGWRIGLVAQVGTVENPMAISESTCRKLGANLMALRSERIQPGINAEEKAPRQYHAEQEMDVPEELAAMAGRAAYNSFAHWTQCDRENAKKLMLMERVDVLTPGGKERLRAIRQELSEITDRLIARFPLWADLPTGKAFTKNAARGRKAFALAGQRIYIGGLDKNAVDAAGIDGALAVQALGAAASRGAQYCEIAGLVNLPDSCDLLTGTCLMAGPVNQNDIGKQFYGYEDLLAGAFPDVEPTSLLVWTLKAKTVADPIGNEEQLMNEKRKGSLVDLRGGPHEIVEVVVGKTRTPLRSANGQFNQERAFGDQGNFVSSPKGKPIPGNQGETWPVESLW
jgi:hypothetical protein